MRVKRTKDDYEALVHEVSESLNRDKHGASQGCGLVFATTKKQTVELAEVLQNAGVDCEHWHSALPEDEKRDRLTRWMEDRLPVLVCTSAFGLGIDKKHVNFVHHFTPPFSLGDLQQHLGRARCSPPPAKAKADAAKAAAGLGGETGGEAGGEASGDVAARIKCTLYWNPADYPARPPDQIASWSVQRALLTPQANPGSLYRGRGSS